MSEDPSDWGPHELGSANATLIGLVGAPAFPSSGGRETVGVSPGSSSRPNGATSLPKGAITDAQGYFG